jgi:Leucine-rich repeat (LRR) protein
MSLVFRCHHCGQGFRGTEAMLGKRVKCPRCGGITPLTLPNTDSPPAAAQEPPAPATDSAKAKPAAPAAAVPKSKPTPPDTPAKATPQPTKPAPVRATPVDEPRAAKKPMKAKPAAARLEGEDDEDAPRPAKRRAASDTGATAAEVKPKAQLLTRILVFLLALAGAAGCGVLYFSYSGMLQELSNPVFAQAATKIGQLPPDQQHQMRLLGLTNLREKRDFLEGILPMLMIAGGASLLGGLLALLRLGILGGVLLLVAGILPPVYDPFSILLTVFPLLAAPLAFFIRTRRSALAAAQKRAESGKPPASGVVGYVFAVLFILSLLGYSIVAATTALVYLALPFGMHELGKKLNSPTPGIPNPPQPGGPGQPGTPRGVDVNKEIGSEVIQAELEQAAKSVKLVPIDLRTRGWHLTMLAPEGSRARADGDEATVTGLSGRFRLRVTIGTYWLPNVRTLSSFEQLIVNNSDIFLGIERENKSALFFVKVTTGHQDFTAEADTDPRKPTKVSRNEALLMIHCAKTLAPKTPPPADPAEAIKPFLNGELSEELWFNIQATDTTMKLVSKLPNVRSVNLLSANNVTPDGVANLKDSKQLKELTLGVNTALPIAMPEVAKLEGLKILNIPFLGSFKTDSFQPLAANKALEFVNIRGNSKAAELVSGLGVIPQLKQLDVSSCSGKDVLVSNLKSLRGLEVLHLASNEITGKTLNELDASALRELKLSDNPITDETAAILGTFTQLEKLNLAKTQITDKTLAVLKGLKKLQVLDLSGTKVTEAGMKQLEDLDELTDLILYDTPAQNYRRPKKVKPALPLDKLPPANPTGVIERLKPEVIHQDDDDTKPIIGLRFDNENITDLDLAHLRTLKTLKELIVDGSEQITDAGLTYIAGLTELEILDLSDTEIEGPGLTALAGMKKLKRLSLPYKPYTAKDLAVLASLTELESCGINLNTELLPKLELLSQLPKLKSLNLPYTPLPKEALPLLGKMTGLENLVLISNDKQEITDADLAAFKNFTKLRYLNLPQARLSAAGLSHFKGCTQLQSLDLLGAKLSEDALQPVAGFSALTNLNLGKTTITDASLEALAPLKQLMTLNLMQTKITGSAFAKLGGLTRLQSLNLSETAFADTNLPYLEPFQNVQYLSLRGTPITGKGLSKLKGTKLTTLDLSASQLNDTGLKEVGELTQLSFLPLTKTKITDAGLPALAKLTKLTALQLEDTAVTGTGFQALKGLDKVVSVNLARTKVNNGGVDAIASLPNITFLQLEGTLVDDGLIPRIKQFTKLQSLNLRKTGLTNKGLISITTHKTLRFLDVSETKVTATQVPKVRQARPNLTIQFNNNS